MKEPNFIFKTVFLTIASFGMLAGVLFAMLQCGFVAGYSWVARTVAVEDPEKKQ